MGSPRKILAKSDGKPDDRAFTKQTWVLEYRVELEVEDGCTPEAVRGFLGGTVVQVPRQSLDPGDPVIRVSGYTGPVITGGGAT